MLSDPVTSAPVAATHDLLCELDHARTRGPLQHIVVPPCPELLQRLQTALAQAEPDLAEVSRIASSDVAMSAALLRRANSPACSAGAGPVQTIGQAMNRLGLEQTALVMSAFLTQRAIKVNSQHLQRFWERSSKRAVAMAFLASKMPGVSADLAYTYGLFCHVGLPVMMQSVKGYAGTMVEARARVDRSFVATENANHKTDHAVVGALVARVWRLSPLVVADRDLASNQQRAGQLLGFLPYLLVLGAFLGGMYLAIDTTAGERERQSLEPLLASPASRAQIVLGKLGATFGFAMVSMMLSLVAFAVAFQFIPLDKLGMKVDFGAGLIMRAGLLMVPLALVFAALQTVVAAYAKSYREAQTYLSLLMLLPMIPSVLLMVSPMKGELWMSATPLLSQNLLIMELARGETVSLVDFALSFGCTLALAVGLVWLAVRIYHREQLAVSA